jgi:deoxyribonuclease-4
MLLGAHESVAGGAHTAIARGLDDGCQAIQIFARQAAQWRARPLGPEEVRLFRDAHAQAAAGWPVLSHGSYLINLCAADPTTLTRSRDALEDELVRAEALGLTYVVLHPGAHLGIGAEDGITAVAASLADVLNRVRGFRVKLLLELTAGQGSCLGCRFEEMAAILERTRGGEDLGICFDTCHVHCAGYDLSTEEGYDQTFAAFDRTIGLPRLRAFHLNDSKTPTGSRVDRHQEIGDGYLGLLPFWRLVNDARFANLPGVLETPSGPDKLPSFKRNLERLRALIGAPRPPGPPRSQIVPDSDKKAADRRQISLF